jgi:hypothetical protein
MMHDTEPQCCNKPSNKAYDGPMRERAYAMFRRAAARLHERACALEKLAASLEHFGLDADADQILFDFALAECNRR